jgi:exodeoxyribonuclease-3
MKITTWNVNGIRAVMRKGFREWAHTHQPDILCLQEVKARPEQVEGISEIIPDGQIYWNPAERPGYSGVASFCRVPPLSVQMGLEDERFDNEGRVVRTRYPDFTLFNIYFPNGQRGHERVMYKLDFYARLLDICDQLHAQGEQVIITGDFNTAHREIDLANPRQNSTTSGFLPEERVWIDYYLAHGFVDAFRTLYPEKIQYTWWTFITNARARNVGWRLDYFLVSSSLMPRVQDVVVHDDMPGSDHCPVTLYLSN